MPDQMFSSRHIPVELSLGEGWDGIAGSPDAHEQIARTVEDVVERIASKLGVPGIVDVSVLRAVGEGPSANPAKWTISIHGRRCRFSEDMLIHAYSYARGVPLASIEELRDLPRWLKTSAEAQHPDAIGAPLQFLGLACQDAIASQAVLLAPEFQAEIPQSASEMTWSAERMLPIVRAVLQLRISADCTVINQILADESVRNLSPLETRERVISALRPNVIEIRVNPEYFRYITTHQSTDGSERFTTVRELLFAECGVVFPDFVFVADPVLRTRGFAFSINHSTTIPFVGLEPGTVFVDETADRLRLLGATGTAATNPATMKPAAIADATGAGMLTEAGLTTWDPSGYLILCLTATLRRAAALMIDMTAANFLVSRLALAVPDLVAEARNVVSTEVLTRVLRGLAADRVSIRDLRRILERLLEYETGECANQRTAESGLINFVRGGLSHAIAYKHSRGTQTLVAYLLDRAIEEAIESGIASDSQRPEFPLDDATYSRLAAAVSDELRRLPESAQMPVILTTPDVRSALGACLAQEFPRLEVISYSDIPPAQNVQPLARITWQ